ncbi:MAG TPA: hypothetical protein VGL40_03755 [Bacillota bacterium]|jgi:hypothetical protein
MTSLDRLILLLTGLLALYLAVHFLQRRQSPADRRFPLYYFVAFAVLLVAGLLLIFLGYGVLANPLVVIVAAFIPLALSAGLVAQLYPKYEPAYLIFAIVGLAAIAVTRFVGPSGLATAVLAVVHGVAGLTIFFAPLATCLAGQRPWSFALVTVGGTLIGIGGLALAFLKAGKPILPATFIFAILAPLLLLMTGSFAWGLIKGGRS